MTFGVNEVAVYDVVVTPVAKTEYAFVPEK